LKYFLFLLFFSSILNSHAQITRIYGKVLSSAEKLPIQGATINYGGLYTISDKDGFYNILVDSNVHQDLIIFSAIGYKTKILTDFKFNTFTKIQLYDSVFNLPEINISSGTNALIKKAIDNISINYPQTPFILSGLLRLFYNQNNGYNYYNDAIIENYVPPYNSHKEISVRLIENSSKNYFKAGSKNTLIQNWVSAYKIVANYDFIHKPFEFLSPKTFNTFTFKLIDKFTVGSERYFTVEFKNKTKINGFNYLKIEGKLIIDSTSLAFVKGDFTIYNLKDPFYKEIEELKLIISYKKYDKLWYVDNIFRDAIYKETNNIKSNSKIYYISKKIDTNYIKEFNYSEKIQNSDITQKLNIPVKSVDSINFINHFSIAEEDCLIPKKSVFFPDSIMPIIDTKKSFFGQLSYYFTHSNISYSLNLYQLPFKIKNNNLNFSKYGNVAVGFSTTFRLYHNLCLLVDAYFNFNTVSISNNENTGSISLTNLFKYKFLNRNITLSPIIGVNKIKISNSTNTISTIINNYHYGFSQQFELTHRFSLLLTELYNNPYNYPGSNLDFISSSPLFSSLGIKMNL